MANEHKEYLDNTWPGGSQAYIASQQERYVEAVKSGDKDLISRLIADASRVGYTLSLPSVPSVKDNAGKSPAETILGGGWPMTTTGQLTTTGAINAYKAESGGIPAEEKGAVEKGAKVVTESIKQVLDIDFGPGLKTGLLVIVMLLIGSAILNIIRR